MDKTPAVLTATERVRRSAPVPRLRLLTELEPRHRVFMGNLADLLWSRPAPRIPITSRPGRFWDDVFVPTGAPWSAFLESMLLQSLLIVLFVWGQSRVWVSVNPFPQRVVHRSITYYPPARSFPAAEGRASRAPARPRVQHTATPPTARQPALRVRPQAKPSLVTPPDIKQATAKLPNLPNSQVVPPMVPFAATANPRRNALASPSAVVAPPPDVHPDADQARRLALPQAAAVAPAPELGGPSARAGKVLNPSDARVVPPPPSVQGAGNARTARSGSMAGAGSQVVPPPPSVQGANGGGGTRLSSVAGSGPNIVPPPPLVQGAGNATGAARLGSMAGAGSQVVPPPPSVQGAQHPAGSSRLSSLSGAGPNVVPPAPSVGNGAGAARLGSMAGAGSQQVVPPPPSVQSSSGSAGGGRLNSLSGAGSEVLPPPSSVEGAGNSGAGGVLQPMDHPLLNPLPIDDASAASAASAAQAGNGEDTATLEDLPLGLLGVVFAAPGTSYFSNFEVFVAKRRVGKDQLQLIKLVYEFLPYQRRLSEYDLNNQKLRVIKLRVIPDPSCDESLAHMIQPQADPTGAVPETPKLPAALLSTDLNAPLPCYRTNADDFRKAMLKAR